MSWWGYSSRMQEVKGGIKAQSKRGSFGSSWWAERWNAVLEGYNIGARLGRGRSYARKGQVSSIDIRKGAVRAVVHGSWKYSVEIKIKMLSDARWKAVADRMLGRPAVLAGLLAGRMPEDIEALFEQAGTTLFPRKSDLETNCTCPDWSNPCKHIAAVYLLLAEEFDRDPFLLLRLRGMERSDLLDLTGIKLAKKQPSGSARSSRQGARRQKSVPIPDDPLRFWGGEPPDGDPGGVTVPAVNAALVRQLGSFPFWRGEDGFVDSMEEIYEHASKVGMRSLLDELEEK